MARARSVVINGDLGSGKTTVSVLLARRLGVRRISVGDVYRAMAAERGLTALQLSLHAELDDKIDQYLDQLQGDIAASGEQVVVDSRLAWHFFTDALKVHMLADPAVAAARALGRPASEVERYRSVDHAREQLASRSESERVRFLARYGVDKTLLRNYDIICDSTSATPEEIVEVIAQHVGTARLYAPEPLCYIDPARVVRPATPGQDDAGPLRLVCAAARFIASSGWGRVDAAVRTGAHLVEGTLIAESD